MTCEESKKPLEYDIGENVMPFGSPLIIHFPQDLSQNIVIIVDYETQPSCSALQWLTSEQTCSKKHPYLFSQCQAIQARSLLPCQDSPGVKMPYTAKITAPAGLTVLMSAIRKGTSYDSEDKTKTVHQFEQKIPIPSYLIAIVVGALESRVIGPRTRVWSEKEMVDAAAHEFAETEEMLSIAEQLVGPYVWGTYDLLVLPPSFPFGGMENPCLTFVTPTVLAGDRSLALVVAHELTHSWTGNLVTNKNPEHFWLNEGHTMFIERKIAGRMKGEKFRHLLHLGGWNDLLKHIEEVLDHPFTCLVLNIKGIDPDDALSVVPYEKGSTFLMYLEQKLGGPEVFDPFLKAYIERFKFKSITTDEWKAFLYEFFYSKKTILDTVDWKSWLYLPGMPPVKPKYDTSLTDAYTALASRWIEASDENDFKKFNADDVKDFSAYQLKDFLGILLNQPPMTKEKISYLNQCYGFDGTKNSEIRFRWIRICLAAHLESYIPEALQFVSENGRNKFVRPIYRDLHKWEVSKERATENYKRTKSQMHPLTATLVAKDLHLTS